MTSPTQPKQWISLGLLIGGHSPSSHIPPLGQTNPRPEQQAPPARLTERERTAVATMLAAGYEPLVRYPGKKSSTWESVCSTCKQPRFPSLQDAERGVRCRHVKRQRNTTR